MTGQRQPTYYLTHGGGPCFWMAFPPPFGPHAYDGLRDFLSGLVTTLPDRPKAVLVVTAHWETAVPTVSTAPAPGMLYDYSGFPPHTYHLTYPAPGAPDLAQRVRALLTANGIPSAEDDRRGYDHGVFVPMMIIDPAASIPVLMMSMRQDLDPAAHLAIGMALQPLRDEGVLIIGSGSSFHNMRQIFDGALHASRLFDTWMQETVTNTVGEARNARLLAWDAAPGGRECHPRPDHLIPLMVAAGAAADEPASIAFQGLIGGKAYSCFRFGVEPASSPPGARSV